MKPISAVALAVAAVVAFGAADASAVRARPHYAPCRHEHLSIHSTTTGSLRATHLRVDGLSCAKAAAAVKAGSYQATPGGPLFSTSAFKCTSPVGPPPPGSGPRYYRCHTGSQRFEFLVPGFS